MNDGRSPAAVISTTMTSGGEMQRMRRNEGGIIPIIILIAIVGIFGVFSLWAMASINWKGIIAVFAAGIVAMAVAGAVFFKANWSFVMMSMICALAIVFILEVGFITLIGGLMILLVLWNYKMFSKNILIFALLVIIGLIVMIAGKYLVMVPLGMM